MVQGRAWTCLGTSTFALNKIVKRETGGLLSSSDNAQANCQEQQCVEPHGVVDLRASNERVNVMPRECLNREVW